MGNQWAALNGKAVSPRDEILFDMPQNSSFRFAAAEANDELIFSWHGVVAYRKGDLKLIFSQSNETWYPPGVSTGSCPMAAFASECEANTPLKSTCSWDRYLFNVSEAGDVSESQNLYYDAKY